MYHFKHRISSLQNILAEINYVAEIIVLIKPLKLKIRFLLVCQSASKVILDVGVHDRSEVVVTAIPEQVNDENLSTQMQRCYYYFQPPKG